MFANDKVAQVPAELSKIVGSVLGLQNVSTYHTLHSGFRPHTTAQSATAQAVTTQAVTGSQVAHIPTQYPGIYSVGSTPAASNAVVATIAEGSMTNVAVDFAKFLTNNPSLPALTPTYVYVGTQSTDTSGDVEWDLDTQVIYGTAGALKKMYVYVATSLTDADLATTYNRAVSDNFASIINVSLGECEAAAHTSGAQATDDTIFKAAVAQGQTFSVAAGDAGPYNCQTDSVGTPGVANTNTKRKAYDVSEPASSPYVVAVGGTGLYTTSAGAYGGEVVWNEGISATGDGTGSSRLWATGGGFSKYEARPTWQTISSSFPAGFRGVPDIAFDAASASGTNIYTDGQYGTVGGTSMAAPLFVGIWARMESAHSNSLGFPNPAFYASIPSNPTLVNDVTSGYNGWNTTYKGMVSGTGWDADTGFGSLNIANLNTFITNNTALFPKH